MTTPIVTVLERLEAVRKTGADRWIARCPGHDDSEPSLSVKETEDGTILLKCWAGCEIAAVMEALGLSLRELFPQPCATSRRPIRGAWTAIDALRCLSRESVVLLVAAETLAAGKFLNKTERALLAQAASRIRDALSAVENRL